MTKVSYYMVIFVCLLLMCCANSTNYSNQETNTMDSSTCYKPTPEEQSVNIMKGSYRRITGSLLNNKEIGTNVCKECDAPLYRSEDRFELRCGWPRFDDEIPGAVRRETDADG